jgi:hypothetical protein
MLASLKIGLRDKVAEFLLIATLLNRVQAARNCLSGLEYFLEVRLQNLCDIQ